MFKKISKQQRERLKARRVEGRKQFVERVADEALLACYCYVGCADSKLSQPELEYLGELFPSASGFASPTKEALGRKVRSYLMGASPTLAERRRLRRGFVHFAGCDGPLTADERTAVGDIEDLLGISPERRSAKASGWSTSRRAFGSDKVKDSARAKKKVRTKREAIKPQPRLWCYDYLGCSETDSDEVIKRCYRQLAVKLHPDKHASRSKTAEEVATHVQAFQKLQAAYAEICDMRRKVATKR